MKLWIFGDSFSFRYNAELPSLENNISIWSEQLAKLLGCDTIEYRSNYGYSNDYIFKTVLDEIDKFEENDTVIVQLTDPSRRWFIKEDPTYGNYMTILTSKCNQHVTKEKKNAVKAYINYLYNEESDQSMYIQAFMALCQILSSTPVRNWKILPGFVSIPGTIGTMCEIANFEFPNQSERQKWYDTYKIDPRQNHMSKENHTIFAEKMYNWIKNPDSQINLLDGFKKGFLHVN
jgi:hypothetical protein